MEAATGLAIFTWIIFLVMLVILVKYGWGPIVDSLQTREESIREDVTEAEKQREKAENLLQEREKQLDQAHSEAREIIDEAREKGEDRRTEIIEEAREKRESMIESAENQIEAERKQALESLQEQIGDLSLDLARQILRREIDEETHRQMVSEFMDDLQQEELTTT